MQIKLNWLKIVLLVIAVMLFDVVLEYIITSIKISSDILNGYLASGIFGQALMFLFGLILYVIFIDKNVFKKLFHVEDKRKTKKYIYGLIIVFPFVLVIVYTLVYLMDSYTWLVLTNSTVPSFDSLWKIITFKAIFPGLGEETLYRGLLLSVLLYPYFVLNKKPKRHDVALSILIVAVVFTVAHFGYNFSPFQVKYDSYQLVTALFLGAFEGYVFYKTKNIVGSIFIHNISNLMLTAFPILIGVIF